MRNSAKPSIHPRREAQQLQQALLERAESRQMAIDLIHAFHHCQRHLLKRFQQPFCCRPSRCALGIAGRKARQRLPCCRQRTPHHELQPRQHPQGDRSQPHQPGGMVISLHRHRPQRPRPPLASSQTSLPLIGPAIGQHRWRQCARFRGLMRAVYPPPSPAHGRLQRRLVHPDFPRRMVLCLPIGWPRLIRAHRTWRGGVVVLKPHEVLDAVTLDHGVDRLA